MATPSGATAHEWSQLVDLAITRREVHMEQLQLFVSGALRHPALVNKDGAFLRGSPSPVCGTHSHSLHPRLLSTARAALLSHVSRIRRDGVLVIECIGQWRRALVATDPEGMSLVAAGEGSTSAAAAAAFRAFVWRGQDYLAKMLHDADFLAELGAAPRMLELGAEALRFNPLFAPTTLSNAVRMPPLPSVASYLIDRCVRAGQRARQAPPARSRSRSPHPLDLFLKHLM